MTDQSLNSLEKSIETDTNDLLLDLKDLTCIRGLSDKGLKFLNFIRKIPQYPQKSAEWFQQRSGKLTSSDAGTVLGLNPYGYPAEVFFKKCGYPTEFTGNVATLHGQKYETEAIEKYSSIMNMTNYEFGLIDYSALESMRTKVKDYDLNYDLSFLAGSPDGVAVDHDTGDLVLIEVKCPYRRKIKFGYIPEYYYPQVQLNMLILDLYVSDFIEYIPAKAPPLYHREASMNIVRIYRSDKWLSENIPKLVTFWSLVKQYKNRFTEHPDYEKFIKKCGKKK